MTRLGQRDSPLSLDELIRLGSASPLESATQELNPQKQSPHASLQEVSSEDELSSEELEAHGPQYEQSEQQSQETLRLAEVDSYSESLTKDGTMLDFSKGLCAPASYKFKVFETLSFLNVYNYQARLVELDKTIRTGVEKSGTISKQHKDDLARLPRKYRMFSAPRKSQRIFLTIVL